MPRPVARIVAALVLMLGVLAVVTRVTSLSDDELARNDFTQDYVAARAWRAGDQPYAPTQVLAERYLGSAASSYRGVYEGRRDPHPPAQIVLAAPLSATPFRTARSVWLLMVAASIVAAISILAHESGASKAWSVVAGVGALAIPIAQHDLVYGQSMGIILLLLVVTWRGLRRDPAAARDLIAGAALGLATAIKFFPALMLVPLIRQRRMRMAVTALAVAAITTIMGVAALGADATREFLTVAAPENIRFWRSAPMNVSAVSMPLRWLTQSVWQPQAPNVPLLAAVLAIVIFAGCILGAVRAARSDGEGFWGVAPWMILATPLAWSFSLLLVLPSVMLALARARRARGQAPVPLMLAGAVVALGVLPGLPLPAPGNPWPSVVFGYALPTYALIYLGIRYIDRQSGYSL